MIIVPRMWKHKDIAFRSGYKDFESGRVKELKPLNGLGAFDIQRNDAYRAGWNWAKREAQPKAPKPKKVKRKPINNKIFKKE